MANKSDDPFWTDPELTITLKHCGITSSVSLKVEEADYLMICSAQSGNTERLYDAYSKAISDKASNIASTVLHVHKEFEQALRQAETDLIHQ